MSSETSARRPYGTGSLFVRNEAWYGQWRVGGRLVKRKLGDRRSTRNRSGLSRSQAERALSKAMREVQVAPEPQAPRNFGEIGEAYVSWLEQVRDLKATTLADYRSILRHWDDFFGARSVRRLGPTTSPLTCG